jgi:hypothetical protein
MYFFDGTSQLGAPILTGAGNMSVLGVATWVAVSFMVNETDPSCGRGRWSLTQLQVPLSQVANATANIQLQLYMVNVSVALCK